MRIGYISYEHPLGIAGGGIGTYLGQIARLMSYLGHQVEVFTAHKTLANSLEHEGYLLHRVQARSMEEFRINNVEVFSKRHTDEPFDIIEAAEYGADALFIKKKFRELPLVVKLHTPSYLTHQLNSSPTTAFDKTRFYLGGLLRGKRPEPYWVYKKEQDPEYEQYCLANALCSPSKSLAKLVKEKWPAAKAVEVIPNPFGPDPLFLDIPVAESNGKEMVISFFGRLEKRKGILELMGAIPFILDHDPTVVFQFVGSAHPSPLKGLDMEAYLKLKLKKWGSQLRFAGYQPYNAIPALLAKTHICVFPSLWENFPNVCLEAMVAGRAVIGTDNGGMADMITDTADGLLIPPGSPESIARAVVKLMESPAKIKELGQAARKRIMEEYNQDKTGKRVIDFYKATIYEATGNAIERSLSR